MRGTTAPAWAERPRPAHDEHLALCRAEPGIGPVEALLLYHRGIRAAEEARSYLNPEIALLSDPLLLPDMPLAVQRLARAVDNGERIAVYGDFDVDGISGASLLTLALRALGAASVVTRIPSRDGGGHGLISDAVHELAALGVSVLVTVDTGTTQTAEISIARSLGIDTIVTDHHLADEPARDAFAVVNPQFGESHDARALTGAGVAFKLALGLHGHYRQKWPRDLLALAALGTVGDVAPLSGENRVIVAEGLAALAATRHPGLAALLSVGASNKASPAMPDTEFLTFNLIPRLNAAGRIGDPRLSLDLLSTTDPNKAAELAQRLDTLNAERRELSESAWRQAGAEISTQDLGPLVVFSSSTLHPGVIGPLAGRLCQTYGRPAVAISVGEDTVRGSIRSTPGFDAHAALVATSGRLEGYGGHARAAGFSAPLRNLDAVLEALREQAVSVVPESPQLMADATVSLADLQPSVWDFVKRLEPTGEGNPAPVFISRGLGPSNVKAVGNGGDHLRLTLEEGTYRVDAVGFGLGHAALGAGLVDVAYSLRANHWRGRERRELQLLDISPSGQPPPLS